MAGKVISFRLDDEVYQELEQKSLPGESPAQAGQRILKSALGFVEQEQILNVSDRLKSLEDAINKFAEELPQIKFDVQLLKESRKSKPTGKPEIRSIGYLKQWGIIPKTLKPTDADIDKIFDGIDGSQWQYLGHIKGNSNGLLSKQFQRVS